MAGLSLFQYLAITKKTSVITAQVSLQAYKDQASNAGFNPRDAGRGGGGGACVRVCARTRAGEGNSM